MYSEAFIDGRIAAHEHPARLLETRDSKTHFARPFGINPFDIWDDNTPNGFTQEYSDWNKGYEMETTLSHFLGSGH